LDTLQDVKLMGSVLLIEMVYPPSPPPAGPGKNFDQALGWGGREWGLNGSIKTAMGVRVMKRTKKGKDKGKV
jgi:hypothetical protein